MSSSGNGSTTEDSGLTAVPDVLATVSHEIRVLSDTAAELQNVIGNILVAGGLASSASLYELQSLDRLCQSLEAISDFVGELSKQARPDWQIDVTEASRTIRLAELCHRMSSSPQHATDDSTGDFDCFESWQQTG